MINMQHTSGYWIIESDALGEFAIITKGGVTIAESGVTISEGGVTIADVYGRNPATARLISAAPEMLDALQAILKVMEGDPLDVLVRLDELEPRIRAAIAKATEG